MDVAASIDQINNAFRNYREDQKPAELYEPITYMLNRKTDRFYALLTLWSCFLFSGDYQKALNPCLGVEVFFNFLKVHSDLLDKRSGPPGEASVHEKWDRNVAILSGDAMIFKAYEFLIQVEPELIESVVNNFNRCFTRICEGKQIALSGPETHNDLKTLEMNPGALGEFSMLLGALVGMASPSQQDIAGRLGLSIAVSLKTSHSLPSKHSMLQSLNQLECPESRKQRFEQWLLSQT